MSEPGEQDGVAQVETAPSASLRTVFRRFWPDTRGIRGRMLLSLLLVPVAPALTTVSVYLFKVLVDDVLTPHDYRLFVPIALAYLGLAVVGGLVSFVDEYLTAWVGETFVTNLRVRVFAHLQRLSVGWFERHQLGDVLSRLTGDIGAIEQLVLTGVNMTLTYAFQLVFFAGMMFFLNWQLTLASFLAAPAFLLLSKAFSRRIQAASRERRRRSGSITAVAEENLGNLALVQAYDRADDEVERFAEENRGSFRAQMLAIRLEALFGPFSSLVEAIGVLVVIGVAVYELSQNQITLGGLLAFLTYLSQLYGPVQGFAGLSNMIFSASAGAERVLELTDQEPAVVDPVAPAPLGRATGALRFERVDFTYPGVDQPALRGVELHIEPGQKVAIVGASGAGKSTLTKMLLRTYDPDRGRVTLDGIDLRDISLSVLRGNMAVVLQETLVFDGTIADNIRWGRPEATDEEVEAAARAADAHGFITRLDQGYGTRVGQRGRLLSGGQRQRLAIARAMIRDAPVLLLDEPTTGLDAESGQRVLAPLRRLMSGRTTIIISHDLLTVADADRIVVLDGGAVTAVGTHEQLLAGSPTYMRLWALHHPGAPRAVDQPTSHLPRVRPRPAPVDPRPVRPVGPAVGRSLRKPPPLPANPVAMATERLPAVNGRTARGRHSLSPSPRPRHPADNGYVDPPTALRLVVSDIVRGALGGGTGRRSDPGPDLPRPYPLPRPRPAAPADAPSGRHAAPARPAEPADARG